MPVRLAAMPRTPDDAGRSCDAPESLPLSAATGLVRRLERLGWSAALTRSAETACSTSTTGAGFGLGLGLALTTPSKPISPNRGATTAAREGTAVETATASSAGAAAGATAGLACGV